MENNSTNLAKTGFFDESEFMKTDEEKNFDFSSSSTLPLSSPIYLDLLDNGGQVKFKSFQDALNWANEELDAWRYVVVSTTPTQRADFVEDIINQQTAAAENIAESAKEAIQGQISTQDATAQIRRYLDVYTVFNCVHSRSVLGKMAITMERYRPMVLGMLAGATASATPEAGRSFTKSSDAEAFTFGYALALQFRNSNRPETIADKVTDVERRLDMINKRLSPTETALSRLNEEQATFSSIIQEAKKQVENSKKKLKNSVEEMTEETKKMIEGSVDGMWSQIDDLQIEQEEQVQKMKKTIASHLKVRASVEYWMDMAKAHATRASQATGWFIITGLISIMSVLATAYGLNRSNLIPETGVDVIVLCSLGLPVFVAVVLLTMIAKTRARHERLASVAEERVAMVETYTSLESEGKALESERHLILQALFRPSYSSSVPGMPSKEKGNE